MTYVITEACAGAKHTNCVEVCPVDAFREGVDMLYIDPDECIDCNACLTECPELAIYPEARVPAGMEEYIEINAVEAKRHPVITERIDESADRKVAQTTPASEQKRFAVVGAGPSGFFASEALLKQFPGARIDLIESLPTPFGLVRYGVAPDHPEIKSVAEKFTSLIRRNPGLHFFGNVEVGKDIQRDDLLNAYDYVIYTTGGSASKQPAVPGIDRPGVYGSSEFVGWYNGHPEHKTLDPKLDAESMVVIGVGNVALDIARIVCLPATERKTTDIADHALEALAGSRIRDVTIVARRGPAQAAFTPNELQELIDHEDINLIVDASDLDLDPGIEAILDVPENGEAKENVALLRSILQRESKGSKTIRFVFHAGPEEIEGDETGPRALRTSRNKVTLGKDGQAKVETTGEGMRIDAGIIVYATGYRGRPLEGLGFDAGRGTVAHREGRALLENGELADREYVAGWIKRGATGVIGTNKQCAVNTVKTLIADSQNASESSPASPGPALEVLLERNNVDYFTFADWLALDAYERKNGLAENRPRRKVIDLKEMLEVKAADRAKKTRQASSPEPAARSVKEYDASQPVKTHYRPCTLCEAMCGIKIEYQGERILDISGDEQDPHSNGHICPKGYALQDLHNDPDRLKTPLKRVGDQWLPIDWDEALDEVADRIVSIQKEHGPDAVGAYWGNPASHSFDIMTLIAPFRKALGSRSLFTASSLDQMPHQLTSYLMFGHSNLISIPDLDRTGYMLMLGANPAASNGSLMTAGDVLGRLEKIQERGGKLVLIDPRRTETALYASEHVFIKPGTDALFLLGLIQVIINKGLTKPAVGLPLNGDLDDLEPLVNSISLTRIAEVTKIPEEEIERIACEFAQAEQAVCYGRMGLSTQQFGALNHWLMQILNIITGNLDQPGGMMFTTPAVDMLATMGRGGFGRHHSRVRNLPEFSGEYPATTLADEILTPGEGQIRAFVCIAGNPVISVPNARKLEKALEQLDFMVSIDFYLSETSRQADIILPPSGPLEHAHYDLIFNSFAVRNVTRFSAPLFEKKSYMRSDRDILSALITRIKARKEKKTWVNRVRQAVAKWLSDKLTTERMVDLGLRQGPYGDGLKSLVPGLPGKGLTLAKLREHEHGLDLGPLESRLPERLFTPDKKVQLFPELMLKDMERLKAYAKKASKTAGDSSLMLIGRRDLRTNNSWMHNSQRLVKGKNRCDLFIHPDTAGHYGISHGQKVQLHNDVGMLNVTAALTEDIMPNVVSLPHGWGHDKNGMRIPVASANPGINMNDLTDEKVLDELSGNAVLNGVPVEIRT